MKQAMLKFMNATGLFAPLRFANRHRALILTYHRFGDNIGDGMLPARALSQQLNYLANHYEIVPLSFIADRIRSGQSLPEGLAAITIDDGYEDAYRVAFPILRNMNLPATLFVVTEFVDRKIWMWTDKMRYLTLRAQKESVEAKIGELTFRIALNDGPSRIRAAERINAALKSIAESDKHQTLARLSETLGVELPAEPPSDFGPISWEQAREMDRAGVEVASHTLTHPILTRVDGSQLRRELSESRGHLESILGRKVDHFCYPNGNYNNAVVSEVERAGYSCAVTVEHGLNAQPSNPLALKRVHTEADIEHFVQSTCGFEQVKAYVHGIRAKGMSATSL